MRDWSWRQTRRRLGMLARLAAALPRPHGARARLAARLHARRARAAVPREARGRRGDQDGDLGRLPGSSSRFVVVGVAALGLSLGETYLTGWTGERVLADLRIKLFRAPAAALARLLRAQPRRRDHQPDHERRRGARPARHRRRHVARPEHAAPRRHGGRAVRARLAARARDATRPAADGARDGLVPDPLQPRLPPRARAARPRHGDARRGHRRHARRAVVHARAGAAERASAASTTATATRTTRRSSSTGSTSRPSTSSPRSRPRSCSATAASSSTTAR